MTCHRSALERLTRAFSLLLAPVAAGCAAEGEIDLTQFTENLCPAEGLAVLQAVEPADPVDYAELRSAFRNDYVEDPADAWGEPFVIDRSGEPCSGAADPAACQTALDGLPLMSEYYRADADGGSYQSVAYTRGDQVGAVTSKADLDAFLGVVDAPGDAALHVHLLGHSIVCGDDDDVGTRGDDYIVHTSTGWGCGEGDDIREHIVVVHPNGEIEVVESVLVEQGDPNCAVGRLPAGLCRRRVRRRRVNPVGRFFAEVAHLEGAAVAAFEQLARELTVHGAPRSFVASARRSRNDEVRHAVATGALARRYGATPDRVRVTTPAPRSLLDVAADNAAEGCIRETYGALVAHRQARRAADPVVRRALASIARDETRHAALSWDLDAWARARMSRAERRRLDTAKRHAFEELEHALTRPEARSVQVLAGMPSAADGRAMFEGLRRLNP